MKIRGLDRITLRPKFVAVFCGAAVLVSSYSLGRHLTWGAEGPLSARSSLDAFSQMRDAVADSAGSRWALHGAALPTAALSLTPDAWKKLTSQLRQMAVRYHGHVAIDLQNLNNGETWTYNANERFPAASLIKVPIMIAVFEKIHEGALSLTQTMVLRRHNRVGGSGTLKWRPDGTRLMVSQLLDHMIRESDNTAANMLIEAVGGIPYIQSELPKVGLVTTQIHRQGMSLRSGHVAHENYTTANEMAMLLRRIYKGKMIDPASSRLMLDYLLLKKPVASRLGKGLPTGWEIAHKTGLERRACHDSAIILTPRGDFLLTVLTGNNRAYKPAQKFIARIGHLTYRFYGGQFPTRRSRRRYYAWAGKSRHHHRSHRQL